MNVDLALILAVDCSSSVDEGDYHLQMQGIADALRNPQLVNAIANGDEGRIAFALVQWSTQHSQSIVIKWRSLQTAFDLLSTAQEIEHVDRHWLPGGTGLAIALDFCSALMQRVPALATRKVIDVSGDGEENEGGNVVRARNSAIAHGITINGLPILYGSKYIEAYYAQVVTGGQGSFVIPATNMSAFKDAMTQKLLREIAPQFV